MDVLTRSTDVGLRQMGKAACLRPYLAWKVVEVRTVFDGASKDTVREHFLDWVATRSDERDGPGAAREDVPRKSPRYRACLYVDKAAIDAASMESMDNPYGMEIYRCTGHVVLINTEPPWSEAHDDGEDDEEGDDEEDDQFPPIDGQTDYDVGWMLVKLEYTGTAYERLAESWDGWVDTYMRPPEVYGGY